VQPDVVTAAAVQIPWGTILGVVGGAIGALATVILTLLGLVHKANKKNVQLKYNTLHAAIEATKEKFISEIATAAASNGREIAAAVAQVGDLKAHFNTAVTTVQKESEQTASHLKESVLQLVERVGKYFEAHDRLRDKWEEFLREYLKIDSTRGQKMDALFRIVDQMQILVKELTPTMNAKIEEAFTHAMSELKLYVRDQMREERK
jgi:iron-sulfur cluster repair protein YtfE (RIC family)